MNPIRKIYKARQHQEKSQGPAQDRDKTVQTKTRHGKARNTKAKLRKTYRLGEKANFVSDAQIRSTNTRPDRRPKGRTRTGKSGNAAESA